MLAWYPEVTYIANADNEKVMSVIKRIIVKDVMYVAFLSSNCIQQIVAFNNMELN